MKKIDSEMLGKVTGGAGADTEAAAGLIQKENQASVCGMGTVKLQPAAGLGADGSRTVKAYCPICKKETKFYVGSGAQSRCSVCGNIRMDM